MLTYEFTHAADSASRDLMVMLHGLGDSAAGYRWLPNALQLPRLNYLLVNAPDEYYGGYSWYDFAGDIVPGVQRSRRLLTALLHDWEGRGFPAARMVLGGFSQGGLMSIDVALRLPSLLAGVMGISGYICEPEQLIAESSPTAKQLPILMTHGTLDPIIPIAAVRKQFEILKAARFKVQWHEFLKAHTIAEEAELDLIRDFVRSCLGYD